MLDKSIPYIGIVMRRNPGTPPPDFPLPPGYRFAFYTTGGEKDWARIETSVLEFACEMDALLYFQQSFSPYAQELPRRCLFIETDAGEKIATATAWWGYAGIRRIAMLHWVAVRPSHQGLGIGKALIAEAVRRILEIEGDREIYLLTQSWSHKAVCLYERAGFYITDEKNIQDHANDQYDEAVDLMKTLRPDGTGQVHRSIRQG